MRSHREAHATPPPEPPAILGHPMVPANEPTLVSTQGDLDLLLAELRSAGSFAYDTEFIGEHTYHPQLCVIQVATPSRVTLIDPLASIDLRGFWELLADASVEKIVHAGMQDLEPVPRYIGRPPLNIFDTQIAAGFIGQPYPSAMGKLVLAVLSADVGQGLKFSQWDHRPLSVVQLRYAANDVRYLPLLRQMIGEKLVALGNEGWLMRECETFSDPAIYAFDPATQKLRVRGVEQLGAKQRAVLRALLAWREHTAREHNVPPRALLKDDILLFLARRPIKALEDLGRIRGLPRPVETTYGQALLDVTNAALAGPIPPLTEPRRRDEDEDRQKVEEIWTRVQEIAKQKSIDPAIVASKKEIAQLTRYVVKRQPMPDVKLTHGWRRELLGEMLEKLFA